MSTLISTGKWNNLSLYKMGSILSTLKVNQLDIYAIKFINVYIWCNNIVDSIHEGTCTCVLKIEIQEKVLKCND